MYFLNLEVKSWHGDSWPEKRISIADADSKHCVMISPRYADLDKAKQDAETIAKCVNNHDRLMTALLDAAEALEIAGEWKHAKDAREVLASLGAK